ncbi:MAG: hypothetical protein ABIQ74_13155 [Chitinophagales bacterium]
MKTGSRLTLQQPTPDILGGNFFTGEMVMMKWILLNGVKKNCCIGIASGKARSPMGLQVYKLCYRSNKIWMVDEGGMK